MRTSAAGATASCQPKNWAAAAAKAAKSGDDKVRREATALGVTFGDKQAMAAMQLHGRSADADVDGASAGGSTRCLREDPELLPSLLKLLAEPAACASRSSGLRCYEDGDPPGARCWQIYGDASPGGQAGRRWRPSAAPRLRRGTAESDR